MSDLVVFVLLILVLFFSSSGCGRWRLRKSVVVRFLLIR